MKLLSIFVIILASAFAIFGQNDKLNEKIDAFYISVKYEHENNFSKAIQEIEKFENKYPDDYLSNLRLGWLYYENEDYDLSLKFYSEAVRLSSSSIESLLGMTYPYSKMNKWDKIEDIYKQILDEDDNNYTANLRLGQYYLNTGNYNNARTYLEKVVGAYPSDYEGNLYLGWNYYYLGNKSKAADHFVTALISNPGDSSALEGLVKVK